MKSKRAGMNIYLTFNDVPTGVFRSQVIDPILFSGKQFKTKILLVSFVPFKGYFAHRKKIKAYDIPSRVYPSLPLRLGIGANIFFLLPALLLNRPERIISRGVFATALALLVKKRGFTHSVCYDGRGAASAEAEEYYARDNRRLREMISQLEKKAVLDSDHRIAVSHALITYWEERFGFSRNNAAVSVIPCTLSGKDIDAPVQQKVGGYHKFPPDKIVFVYSGSSAEWQSFKMIIEFAGKVMNENEAAVFLMLTPRSEPFAGLEKKFPGRVQCRWMDPDVVTSLLRAADYGVLLRENTITNQVSSPTKFAEYLLAGLPVVVSDSVKDFALFVKKHSAGYVLNGSDDRLPVFVKVSPAHKSQMNELARNYFSKERYTEEYRKIFPGETAAEVVNIPDSIKSEKN